MGLQQRFNETNAFYLYGATPAAEGVVSLLEQHGKDVLAFVDRNTQKQEQPFFDKPVLSPEMFLSQLSPQEGVVIVSAYQQEIARFLAEHGVVTEQVYPMLDGMFFPTYGDHFIDSGLLDRIAEGLPTQEERDYLASWRRFKLDGNLNALKPMIHMMETQYNHEAWLSSIQQGGVAIDVGAFDGETSLKMAETGAFSKVLAIEPFASNFEALQRNFDNAQTPVALEAMQIALGAEKMSVSQGVEDVSSRSRIDLSDVSQSESSETIQIIPLDDLALEGVRLIKVDVEGFELDFLAGAKNTLARCRPHIAISAYHHKDHPEAIAKFLFDTFENIHIRVGHHPTAVYELEYYVSFQ